MEIRVKAELREFSPPGECFGDRKCKVKSELIVPLPASADFCPRPNFGITHFAPQQRPKCRCRIDLSSPDTLERDFYAWLKGSEPASGTVPCLFASTSASSLDFATEQKSQIATSFLALDPLVDVKSHHNRWGDVLNSASSDCLSSHSSVSPIGQCSSANSSTSSSCSSSSSSASCVGPFAPCSAMPTFPLHQHHSPHPPLNQQPFHPFFHHHQQYRLMVTPSCADHLPQQKYASKMPSSSALNATAKVGAISGTRIRRKRNVDKASGRGTNLYGRSYCPGRPLSMEERAQIIHLFHGGMKVNAISKQLCISHGCVSKIITRFRETGNLMPSSHSECRRRKRQQQQQKSQQANGPDNGG